MPSKLRGWHARRQRNHVHCVGRMLEEGLYAADRKKCGHENLYVPLECHITKDISTRRAERGVAQKIRDVRHCVCKFYRL